MRHDCAMKRIAETDMAMSRKGVFELEGRFGLRRGFVVVEAQDHVCCPVAHLLLLVRGNFL